MKFIKHNTEMILLYILMAAAIVGVVVIFAK